MLFDSHAHLNNKDMTPADRVAMVAAIEGSMAAGGLDYVMDIGFDPDSSEEAVAHARQYPWCYAAVGCHPHDAKVMDEAQLNRIRQLAAAPEARAIGEIGLDFHYDLSDRDVQREWFRRQIRLANELKMPICIHAREADQEVMDILIEEGAFSEERRSWFPKRPDTTGFCRGSMAGWIPAGDKGPSEGRPRVPGDTAPAAPAEASIEVAEAIAPTVESTATALTTAPAVQAGVDPGAVGIPAGLTGDARVLLHCFSGSAELGRQYVRMGATLSIAGPVTYKNNKKTVKVAETIPLDFLLVETDSPYLAPVPMRGKPNNPANVEYTARKVAEIKGIPFEEVAAATKANALRFYGIR